MECNAAKRGPIPRRFAHPAQWREKWCAVYFQIATAFAPLDWPVLVILEVADKLAPPLIATHMSMQIKWDAVRAVKDAWRVKNGLPVTKSIDRC